LEGRLVDPSRSEEILIVMKLLREVSLLKSLLLFALFTSGVGLVLVCGGFYLYDMHDFRDKKAG